MAVPANEGPIDMARRIAGLRPELGTEITAIASLYAELRYGRGSAADISELRRRIRAFKP
jgi:hypothetical protein